MKKGFTLVELVIVIVIVGILSIVAVPIYKGYVDKARYTEAKALLNTVRTSQDVYYALNGAYHVPLTKASYNDVLGIDARGNKYFKSFSASQFSAEGVAAIAYDDANFQVSINFPVPGRTFTGLGGKRPPYFFIVKNGERIYI